MGNDTFMDIIDIIRTLLLLISSIVAAYIIYTRTQPTLLIFMSMILAVILATLFIVELIVEWFEPREEAITKKEMG